MISAFEGRTEINIPERLNCEFLVVSTLPDQTEYGGMPFGHGAGDCIPEGFHATTAALWSWH
jgi:hypothetical protein